MNQVLSLYQWQTACDRKMEKVRGLNGLKGFRLFLFRSLATNLAAFDIFLKVGLVMNESIQK